MFRYLISHGLQSSQISVLTLYSAQRAKISQALQAQLKSCDSEVLSVFASQGMYGCVFCERPAVNISNTGPSPIVVVKDRNTILYLIYSIVSIPYYRKLRLDEINANR